MNEATKVVSRQDAIPGARSLLARTWRTWRRFPVIPILILGTIVVCALFADFIAPHHYRDQDLAMRNAPPVWMKGGNIDRILGADIVGRDILSRLIYGARISLMVAGVSMISGALVGVTLGVIAGYYGGLVDEILMRIVDTWFAIPFILLALVVVIAFDPSLKIVLILLALLAWSAFVRNIRAETLVIKTTEYVSAARIAGASTLRIIVRHILPGVLNTAVVIATLRVGQLILAEASLSFLGAGIPAPTPAWGLMVSDGRNYLDSAWWVSTFPGMAILLTVLALNFMGDWLRDMLDPRLRQV
jgi:peptide/nickel transport system permease protein